MWSAEANIDWSTIKTTLCVQQNEFENAVYKMAIVLSRTNVLMGVDRDDSTRCLWHINQRCCAV